jgi:hypothetical protein
MPKATNMTGQNRSDENAVGKISGFILLAIAVVLCGCSAGTKRQGSHERLIQGLKPSGPLNFAWKLSGDRSVAPLQVFSDDTHIWLQWLPNQTLPAIFGVIENVEQLATYELEGPYTKLEGRWSGLVFRGAQLQARARRARSNISPQPPQGLIQEKIVPSAPSTNVVRASQPFYAISSTDKNLRQALMRWSGLSGWTFQSDHWAVDVDIPLTATASFTDDFVGSVRALVEATELSERPLQPCFYANQVLRIVPITEVCDRTAQEGARA